MKLAIITPVHDEAVFLDDALASIPWDEGADITHVIVHDGSAEVRKSIAGRYPRSRVIPGLESGSGAAAAHGIRSAEADFYLQLNSDDRLARGAVAAFVACAAERPDVMIWAGDALFFCNDGRGGEQVVRRVRGVCGDGLDLLRIMDAMPLLTACFVHRRVYAEIGVQAPEFEACNDREFMIRAAMASIATAPLGSLVSEIRMHEASASMGARSDPVPPYMAAHLAVADHWLAQPAVSPRIRRRFRNWRARELIRLVVYQLRAGRFREAWRSVTDATARDPVWLLRGPSVIPAVWRRYRG